MWKYVFTSAVIKMKIFHSCHTRVVRLALVSYLCRTRVALVSHSCRTRVASVALVSHSCHWCRTRVAGVWHLCCKLDYIFFKLVILLLSLLWKKYENVLTKCTYSILPNDLVIYDKKSEDSSLEITAVCCTLYLCNKIIPYSIILLFMEWFALNKL